VTPRRYTTLQLRLLGAFVLVAAVAIGAFAGLTLWSAHGEVNDLVHRQQEATIADTTGALRDAYREAGSWAAADLRPARAVAVSGGALLEVRDATGGLVLQAGRGLGPGPPVGVRPGQRLSATYGAAHELPIVVGGEHVGTASIRFPTNTLPPAERQLRAALTRTTLIGVVIAVVIALLIGAAATDAITRPLRRLTDAVRRLGQGERSARVNVNAPGELGELAAAVDAMAANLEREDELRKALTADVAHELRTPVTILAAHCEAILDGVADPTPEHITSLYEEVQRLGRLIEDLEALASAEAAGLRLERRPVDLDAVVRSAADLLAPRFEAAEVELDVHTRRPVVVAADQQRLGQVVRNLLTNALAFSKAGGRVDVDLSAHEGVVRLTVSDTGAGIPPDDLPHVFERFWRGRAAEGTSGSGIGLAVVDELVRAHDGRISVTSETGRGSRFTVELPVASQRELRNVPAASA
jgi:two-component system sensor histidine kinase BaeS